MPKTATTDQSFDIYETVMKTLADKYAPSRTVTVRRRCRRTWMDDECRIERWKGRWKDATGRRDRQMIALFGFNNKITVIVDIE